MTFLSILSACSNTESLAKAVGVYQEEEFKVNYVDLVLCVDCYCVSKFIDVLLRFIDCSCPCIS